MSRARSVLVLNHFAVPRGEPGGTRHVEMFGRLQDWRHLIIAGQLNLTTGKVQRAAPGFKPVWVMPYKGNGVARIANWCTYLTSSLFAGARLWRKPPDVVYASSPHLLAGVAGYILSRLYRRPFALEIRDLWPKILLEMDQLSADSAIYRLLSGLEKFLYRRADAIITMAPGTEAHLRDCGVPAEKIHYIPNAADPADFVPSTDRATLRRHYRFDHFTAVYAGAHGPANGLGALLDAAEELKHEAADIVLVGGGQEKEWLQTEAKRRGLDNVRFLDPVPKTEIPDLLHAADLGLHILADVSMFHSAVSPNKVFDYMAAGLPILTNSEGIVEQWVNDAEAGWFAETRALAGQMRRILAIDHLELMRRGELSRAWIEANQSRSTMTQRLKQLLDNLANRCTDMTEDTSRSAQSTQIQQRTPEAKI